MARSTMADLIARTRTLIFDPNGAVFTDDAIQDALDFLREERRWVALRPMPTYYPGGQILYLDYYHDAQNWEADVQLQDLTYQTITPATSELIVGHWTFAAQPDGIGVRATGKTYDLYGAAADLLETWATQIKLTATDVRTRSQELRLQQQIASILQIAARYRERALPHVRRIFQGDAAPDFDGGGVTYPNISHIGG